MKTQRRVVVIDVVGLSLDHFRDPAAIPAIDALRRDGELRAMTPVFPAVRQPVQASLTTGVHPDRHGIVANGMYCRDTYDVSFSHDFASLVGAERIWDRLKRLDPGLRTAAVFFHNTLFASLDAVIAPQPIDTGKGRCDWCYSKPDGLYEDVAMEIGHFRHDTMQGPLASIESSRWIARAAVEVMARTQPDLMLVCLPHLDVPCQKYGPSSARITDELALVDAEVGRIVEGVKGLGLPGETVFVVLAESAFHEVWGDVAINRKLRDRGLLTTRIIGGREYVDFEQSPAFALVDHQVAHVYVKPEHRSVVRRILQVAEGIDRVIEGREGKHYRIRHPRSGDFVAVSSSDRWFSYYWWDDPDLAPPYATSVAMPGKPGYDPLEFFVDHRTLQVPETTSLVKGSYGHPPEAEHDRVPLLISGAEAAGLPDSPCITDVAPLIERLLVSR